MQPTFLPWMGYFSLMSQVEVFVLLDDFAASHQSWQQRNRLFVGPDAVDWVTVPVRWAGSFNAPLNALQVDEGRPWRRKLRSRFLQVYARAPHLAEVAPIVEGWLAESHPSLADLDIDLIGRLAAALGLTPRILRSSSLGVPAGLARSQRVRAVLQAVQARRYIAAAGAFDYMRDDGLFPVPEVEVRFQRFEHPTYPQVHAATFASHLSIVDALANTGLEATGAMLRAGAREPLTWQEMAVRHAG